MKILVFALSGIGDALMFTPALSKLKSIYPEARIDAMVMFNGNKELYKNLPQIHKVIFINFLKQNPLKSFWQVIRLRGKYDISINIYPSNRKEYNIISFLVGAKKRAAIKYLRVDKKEFGFLNNIRINEDDKLHNVTENLNIVAKLAGTNISETPSLKFPLTKKELEFAEKYLEDISIGGNDLVIGFHAGCATLKNHINRRWAPDKFADLAKSLIEINNAKILLFGGPDEIELNNTISQLVNLENLKIVKTNTLPESVSLMKRCNVFVTNDSALMHIASALKLKVVAIIGPTNTNYIAPWQTEHKIVSLNLDCAPCFYYSPKPLTCTRKDVKYKCVKEIQVQQVYEAVTSFLN